MDWNIPQQQGRPQPQATDPWASSFPSTNQSMNNSTANAGWASTSYNSAPQWPSSTATYNNGASQWPAANSTTQAPSSNAWASTSAANTSTTSAWPAASSTVPSTAAGTSGQWNQWQPNPSPTAANANANPWGGAPPGVQQRAPTVGASAWPTSTATNTSSAWPSTTAANTSSAWPETSWQQQPSQMNTSWTSTASSRPIPASTQPANPFVSGFSADPFATTTANTSYRHNMSYQQPQNASYASASSFNPFDVTNDDAGFFSNSTAKPAAPQQQQQQKMKPRTSAPDTTPAPSEKTQRLLRVASMLFERGTLIKADKVFIQEMVLRGDRKAEQALEIAERDGTLQEVHAAILAERKKGSDADSDSEDERAEAAANSFKKRPSIAQRKNSDDDDDQTETLDVYRRESKAPGGGSGLEAPHPAAGGYAGTIPQEMGIQKGQFVGTILMRISSKKMFRKWKPVFFALDRPRLVIFESRREWDMGASPKFVIPIHECMWIAKPTLKKTYSLIDDGRRVYYSTLKENSPSIVAQASMSGMERPTAFSPALESRVVAKFGSHYPDEISSFAHAIYSCVLVHQKEAKQSLANSGGGGRRFGASSGFN
jgi:hypothetical protein